MIKLTKVFILTIKNSPREFQIRKRLNYLKINYKIFYAIDGKDPNNYKILNNKYNREKSLNKLGKHMTYAQISIAEGHLRIYKYIIEKNISNAIVMEDDCFPSKDFHYWLSLNKFFKNQKYDLIQIYHSFGLVTKKPEEIINQKFYIHKTCFTLPYATCYQISKRACKYIFSKNKKITGLADWPINFSDGKIKQFVVLPHIVSVHYLHEETSSQNNIWNNFKIMKNIKKYIPLYKIFVALFYLFHIPFIFRVYKNYSYYKEIHLLRNLFLLKNLFLNHYIDLEKTSKNKSCYSSDILDNVKKLNILKNEKN